MIRCLLRRIKDIEVSSSVPPIRNYHQSSSWRTLRMSAPPWCWNKKSPLSLVHWTKIGRVQFNIHRVKNQLWGSKSFDLGTHLRFAIPKSVKLQVKRFIMHHSWPQEYLPGTLHNQFEMDVWWFPIISFSKGLVHHPTTENNHFKLDVSDTLESFTPSLTSGIVT